MSGIVGYVGPGEAADVILDGLRRLEYRGYDSAVMAVGGDAGELALRRAPGKLHNLESSLLLDPLSGTYGIGHTRWSTRGKPEDEAAHPHTDATGDVVVVHNGTLHNDGELRGELEGEGNEFKTGADTEVIAHLVEFHSRGGLGLEDAVRKALGRLRGVFALGVVSSRDPEKIVVARMGPPAVVGLGEGEFFFASDVPALLPHTRDLFFLNDGDMAVLTRHGVRLSDFHGTPVSRQVRHVLWDPVMAEKGGYKHFVLKEIYEQPRAVRETLRGRIDASAGVAQLDDMAITPEEFAAVDQVRIVAAGTSWHASLIGRYIIEQFAQLPVEVDYSSEFRYRNPILRENTLTVLISQSGETADTLAAMREAQAKGVKTLAICNTLGSMLTREADGTIYTHAGPEIGVASTKTFPAQIAALNLLALYLAQTQGRLSPQTIARHAAELLDVPEKLESVLSLDAACEQLARRYGRVRDFLFLGRGVHYPIALEGALKLKEISYIHAEGYPAGEMKHGPSALIEDGLPVVVIATKDPLDQASVARYERTLGTIEEVRARGGRVIAVANHGDGDVSAIADEVLAVPSGGELLMPVYEIIPLQLLAYHIGVLLGRNVDQPRNLAKSVTVE